MKFSQCDQFHEFKARKSLGPIEDSIPTCTRLVRLFILYDQIENSLWSNNKGRRLGIFDISLRTSKEGTPAVNDPRAVGCLARLYKAYCVRLPMCGAMLENLWLEKNIARKSRAKVLNVWSEVTQLGIDDELKSKDYKRVNLYLIGKLPYGLSTILSGQDRCNEIRFVLNFLLVTMSIYIISVSALVCRSHGGQTQQ